MPKPNRGETRDQYMERCIPVVMKEGKTNEQAVGQCAGMWKSHMAKNELQTFTVNVDADLVRDEILEGEEYWVAPLVMLTECVANGSQGPLFYPGEELEKWSPAWNYKPIVTPNHPETGSACTKSFLDSHKIGVVLNTKWDGKLRAEGWFHKKRTTDIEPRVANALKLRKMMELSTGLYVDPSGSPGEFKGEKYDAIAVNHRPDHLAILPDKVGACSMLKGAGLLQLNEASHDAIRMNLESKLYEKYTDEIKDKPSLYPPYIREVFDDYCIFQFAGNMLKVGYRSSADKVTLVGDPTKVIPKVTYVPVKNTGDQGEPDMAKSKKELVDGLIANTRTQFKEDNRSFLEELKEEQLALLEPVEADPKTEKLSKNAEEDDDEDEDEDDEEDEKATTKKKDSKKTGKEKKETAKNEAKVQPESLDAYLAKAPPQVRQMINNGLKAYTTEQKRLIGIITSNKRNTFSEDYLKTQELGTLQAMAQLAQNDEEYSAPSAPMYMGYAGPPPMISNDNKEEAMGLPVYNDSEFDKPILAGAK